MACVVCKYFDAIEPAEHKVEREAGRCEHRCGREWNGHTGVMYVRNHRKNIEGWCRWAPEGKKVSSGHVCGQIEVVDFYYNHHWRLDRIGPGERLKDWSFEQYRILLGTAPQEQRIAELEEQNKELRGHLAASRRVSASRLARLKQGDKASTGGTPGKGEAHASGPKGLKTQELEPLPEGLLRLIAAE